MLGQSLNTGPRDVESFVFVSCIPWSVQLAFYCYTTTLESNHHYVLLVHLESLRAPVAMTSTYRARVGGRVDRARADHGRTGGTARRRVNVNTAYRHVEIEMSLCCFIALKADHHHYHYSLAYRITHCVHHTQRSNRWRTTAPNPSPLTSLSPSQSKSCLRMSTTITHADQMIRNV
jgi:hypothetical protein